jgi:hypothetical protein
VHEPVERSDSVGRIERAGVEHIPDADRTSGPQPLAGLAGGVDVSVVGSMVVAAAAYQLLAPLDRTPADAPDAVREEVAS